jgi:Tol biopolymer transport system component
VPVDEYGSAVRVVDVNGTTDTRLTPPATAIDAHFSFDEAALSPDGLRVVYRQASTRCSGDGCGPGPSVEPIALAALDGSDATELPIPAAANEARGSDGSDFFASGLNWSPDGQRVLLSSVDGVVAVGLEPGAPVVIYTTGKVAEGLNLEWSWSEVTWQPVFH